VIIMDQNLDLKTREHWTQLYNDTSQVPNQILKDRQMRDWEKTRSDRRIQKDSEGSRAVSSRPHRTRDSRPSGVMIHRDHTSSPGLRARVVPALLVHYQRRKGDP
jgi:hypothetical protein